MSQVWLITGCSSGLGLSLALAALKAGHQVIATSRNPSKTPDLVSKVESLGGKWKTLDVTDPRAGSKIEEVIQEFGKIDVLVNNAGIAVIGAFEDISEEEARNQMETNFFGPLRLCKAVIPSMRERRSGTIVNISSAAGLVGRPSRCLYSGSKFALEGFTEALSGELASFNITCLIVQPGAFRTEFVSNVRFPDASGPSHVSAVYRNTPVDTIINYTKGLGAQSPGDPDKAAQAIVDVVNGTGAARGKDRYLRLPLGRDTKKVLEQKVQVLADTLKDQDQIMCSTDGV